MVVSKKSCNFASALQILVPWMSGLVNGLQNRERRFESARHLKKSLDTICVEGFLFFMSDDFPKPFRNVRHGDDFVVAVVREPHDTPVDNIQSDVLQHQ